MARVSNEQEALADFLALAKPKDLARFIERNKPIRNDMQRFFGPELDIQSLINILTEGKERQIEKIRDFVGNYIDRRTGRLPYDRVPVGVRYQAAWREAGDNARLAKNSLMSSASHFSKGHVVRGLYHACKTLSESIATSLSAVGLTVRERKLAVVVGIEMAVAAAFVGQTHGAVPEYGDLTSLIDSANIAGYSQTVEMPRAPLEITINGGTASALQGDFSNAVYPYQDENYLLSPYLVTALNSSAQARQYMGWIVEAALQKNLNPILFANQLFRETIHFDPDVIYGRRDSPAGARGFGQFVNGTGARYGLMTNEDFYNPRKSIFAAAEHMHDLTIQYNGDQILAMAAYNGGTGSVNYVQTELGRTNISGPEWLRFMDQRYDTLGKTSATAWHVETREYIADITGQNWDESYARWAAQLQGNNPLHYTRSILRAADSPAAQAIDLNFNG